MTVRVAGGRAGLTAAMVADMRGALSAVAATTVAAIMTDVPEYQASMGARIAGTIEPAVELALDAFLRIAVDDTADQPVSPLARVLEAAYTLGRGEAKAGRTMEALLAAYRVGARVAWQELSALLVRRRVPAATVAHFAQLVFTYIDELSSASATAHRDELAMSGRVREHLLEQLALAMIVGEPSDELVARAERAGWPIPRTITAVVVPASQVGHAAQLLGPNVLRLSGDQAPGLPSDALAVLLVPDTDRRRAALRSALAGRSAVIGPCRANFDAHLSYARVLRTLRLGLTPAHEAIDSEDHLVELVLTSDADALQDLRTRALLPLADLRPLVAERLAETLRSWLLHCGRRDDVAADLGVHPQTVRYRMTQLRELFGDRLLATDAVLEVVVALGVPLSTA